MTSVIPTFRISSRATLDEWVEAFGLELVSLFGDEGDTVGHAELRLGDGWVMAGTVKDNAHDRPIGAASTYWVVEDEAAVDAIHARATTAGATSVTAPHAPDYGGRECNLKDRDGNAWSFGTYAPGSLGV